MKKINWICIVVCLLLFFLENSFAFQNEPDGFRGIKWGTNIETLKDMQIVEADQRLFKAYTKKNDDMRIGAAILKDILYIFWQGELSSVSLETNGYVNWIGLKEATFEKFGSGYQGNQYIERYLWWDNNSGITRMSLEYNEISKEGTLNMYSVDIMNKAETYDKLKAKEGAEKGF